MIDSHGQRGEPRRSGITRGRFLAGGLVAAAALPQPSAAAEPTAQEAADLALVTAFCQSFATLDMAKIRSYLAGDVVYRIIQSAPPLRGEEAIERIREYVERSTSVEFEILESWVKGPVVVNERIDHFRGGRDADYHLTGVFFVRDGKIAEWTDYSIR